MFSVLTARNGYEAYSEMFAHFRRKTPSPIDNANLFSFMTFHWLSEVIFKSRRTLTTKDLPPLSKYDAADYTAQR